MAPASSRARGGAGVAMETAASQTGMKGAYRTSSCREEGGREGGRDRERGEKEREGGGEG